MTNLFKNKKVYFALIAIFTCLLLVLGLSACKQDDGKIHVIDAYGKEQVFDKPLTRLVGSHNPTLNSVVAVGGGGKYLCGFGFKEKADGLYSEVIENWSTLPTVYNNHDFDMDAIRSMNAELAILPESQAKREAEFKEAGVNSFFVQPKRESLDVVKETIKKIGLLVGDSERADLLNNTFDTIIKDVIDKTANASADKRIVFMGQNKNQVVATEMIQNNIIEQAKGINAVVEYDKQKSDVSFEAGQYAEVEMSALAEMNPDIIIVPNYAKFTLDEIYATPELANTKAVQNKQIYMFPSLLEPWDYSTLSCCLGICWTANLLHPNEFTRSDMLKDMDTFYKTLYNKTFSAEKLGI